MQHTYKRQTLVCVGEQQYLRSCDVFYQKTDANSTVPPLKWEMVQRRTRSTSFDAFQKSPVPLPVDAVEVCAVLNRSGKKYLILVAQYRPPVDCVVLEFPAGLVDAGESATCAALRELHEETGYIATEDNVLSVSRELCYEPGFSDSCCNFVRITVDGDCALNASPTQHLDDCEDIEVVLLPVGEGSNALCEAHNFLSSKAKDGQQSIIDAKLYTFLVGISQTL